MKAFFATILLFLCLPLNAQDLQYDLRPGTVRYYDLCGAYGVACVGNLSQMGIEEVVGDTTIGNTAYAAIRFRFERVENDVITKFTRREYLRFDQGKLYRFTENGDSLLQDFGFAKGDSVKQFYPQQDLDAFFLPPPALISIDTTVVFTNGTRWRVLWGDDNQQSFDGQTFVDSVLVSELYEQNWLVPTGGANGIYPDAPFYFVDSIGIVESLWNYRNMALVGYEQANGTLYGQQVHFVTAIVEEHHPVQQFSLAQNYPNPFNPLTTISWELDTAAQVELALFNARGQKVETLLRAHQNRGRHTYHFEPHHLSGGIYFYRLKAGNRQQVRKMLYLP